MALKTRQQRKTFVEDVFLFTLLLSFAGAIILGIWGLSIAALRAGIQHKTASQYDYFVWDNLQYLLYGGVCALTIALLWYGVYRWIQAGEDSA